MIHFDFDAESEEGNAGRRKSFKFYQVLFGGKHEVATLRGREDIFPIRRTVIVVIGIIQSAGDVRAQPSDHRMKPGGVGKSADRQHATAFKFEGVFAPGTAIKVDQGSRSEGGGKHRARREGREFGWERAAFA